jgi:hypothetical protein
VTRVHAPRQVRYPKGGTVDPGKEVDFDIGYIFNNDGYRGYRRALRAAISREMRYINEVLTARLSWPQGSGAAVQGRDRRQLPQHQLLVPRLRAVLGQHAGRVRVQPLPRARGRHHTVERVRAVRALPGRLSALSVYHSKSLLYGVLYFVWARRALNSPKRRFPARAESRSRYLGS